MPTMPARRVLDSAVLLIRGNLQPCRNIGASFTRGGASQESPTPKGKASPPHACEGQIQGLLMNFPILALAAVSWLPFFCSATALSAPDDWAEGTAEGE